MKIIFFRFYMFLLGICMLYFGAYNSHNELYVYEHGHDVEVTITNLRSGKHYYYIEFDYKGEKCQAQPHEKTTIGDSETIRACEEKPGVFVVPSRPHFKFLLEFCIFLIFGIGVTLFSILGPSLKK